MWKRLQGQGREKGKQIGNPVLLETTYDEDQLRHIPHVTDAQNATYQPNTQSPTTPTHAYNHLSPPDPRDYRASEVPTVSSIYSQPSPEFRTDSRYVRDAQPGGVDISPPSSPEPDDQRNPGQPRRFRSMRDVSPVDESRGQHSGGQRAVSNIPVLRKAPPSLREAAPPSTQKFWGGKVAPNSKVRWDEYSGEPTSSNAGKAGSVNPHTYAKTSLSASPDRRPMGYQVSVSGPQDRLKKNASSNERAERVGTKPSHVDTGVAKPREPWKGASGRVEIVQPFKDQAAKQPLNFQRQPGPRVPEGSAKDVSSSAAATIKRVPVPADGDTGAVADDPEEFDTHEDPIKPIVPLKVGRNSPPRSIASPTSPHNPVNQSLASPTSLHSPTNQAIHSYPSPITPTNNRPSATGATEQTGLRPGPAQEPSTPANTKVARKSIESTPGSTASRDNAPTSRFSWTTYNTSTTYQHSPPPSPPPPLPNGTPVLSQEPVSAASSILNRRRPVPTTDKVPTRKPVTATTARPLTMTSSGPPSPRPESTFSTNTHKALPRPPTEISAADHIDILEAQMDDLRIRKNNVHRLLRDLNNMAPQNPLITDFRRARLVEKRKKEFEDEMAEIKREEHDVGLKLHRAWRKRENADANGSESAIWIRRVTR